MKNLVPTCLNDPIEVNPKFIPKKNCLPLKPIDTSYLKHKINFASEDFNSNTTGKLVSLGSDAIEETFLGDPITDNRAAIRESLSDWILSRAVKELFDHQCETT